MNASEFPIVLFSTETGDIRVNAVLRDRTLWLTQKAMAGLFGVKSQAITKHLKNIYATHELTAASTCSKMEQVQNEGGREVLREMVFYNLDAIIAVGYNIHVAGSPVIIIGCASLDVGTTPLMREAILSCKCGKGQQPFFQSGVVKTFWSQRLIQLAPAGWAQYLKRFQPPEPPNILFHPYPWNSSGFLRKFVV